MELTLLLEHWGWSERKISRKDVRDGRFGSVSMLKNSSATPEYIARFVLCTRCSATVQHRFIDFPRYVQARQGVPVPI
jgi:hypothetical protein